MIVVGLLEIIFGRKKETTTENTTEKKDDMELISIDDAEKILSKKFEEKFEPFKKDANKIYQELQSATTNIQRSLNKLAEAKFTEQVDPELIQNVTAHRKSFIQKMEIMKKSIEIPMQSNFDSILDYSQSISINISETNQNTVNDYRFVDRLFEKEGERTINDFKAIGKLSDDLKSLINNNKETLLSVRNVQNELKLVKEEMDVLYGMEEDLKILGIKFSNSKLEHEKEIENIKKIEGGKGWIGFNELLEKKKDVIDGISKLKSELIENTSKIERPLRKLKNMVDKGTVNVDDEKLLEKYANSFLATVMEEKNYEIVNSILKTVQKNISEGKIDLKNNETVDEINHILENNVFENILKKYVILENDLKRMEKTINEHDELKRRNDIDDRIKDLEKQMEISNLEIEKIKKQMEKIKNSVNEKKNVLEESLSGLDNKKIRLR